MRFDNVDDSKKFLKKVSKCASPLEFNVAMKSVNDKTDKEYVNYTGAPFQLYHLGVE